MPRKKMNKKQLLSDKKVKLILECFLFNGLKNALKFSEIKKFTGIKSNSTLYDKLQQLKREGIITQKEYKGEYYLVEKFYNLVIQENMIKNVESFPLNSMFIIDDNIVIYGLYPHLINQEEMQKIREAIHLLKMSIKNAKEQQIKRLIKNFYEKEFKKKMNEIFDVTNMKKKEILDFFTHLINFLTVFQKISGCDISSKNIEEYIKKRYSKSESIMKIIIDLSQSFLQKYMEFYPPEAGFCMYLPFMPYFHYDLNATPYDISKLDEKSIRVLMLYGGYPLGNEDKKFVDLSKYSNQEKFDYLLYIKTQKEFALRDKYFGCKGSEKDYEYWEKEDKKLTQRLNENEINHYKKLVAEWIISRFIYELADISRWYTERNNITRVKDTVYWIKRYKSFGYPFTIKDVIREFKKYNIKATEDELDKIEKFLKEYC